MNWEIASVIATKKSLPEDKDLQFWGERGDSREGKLVWIQIQSDVYNLLKSTVKWLGNISVNEILYAWFKHNNEDRKKEIKLLQFKVGW